MQTTSEKQLTGYPSIDKPWLKYYSEEAINAKLPEKTLWQYIYENNRGHLNNIAFNYFGKCISYGDFFSNVDMVTKAFIREGIGKGDIVTILSMHTPETLYTIYGLNRLGAVANIVYMTLSAQEVLETLKNTNSKAIFVLDIAIKNLMPISKKLSAYKVVVLPLADSMPIAMKIGYRIKNSFQPKLKGAQKYNNFINGVESIRTIKDVKYARDMLAVIVYTSGSTGEPKGVMLSNDNINAVAHQYQNSGMRFARQDTFFNMLPPFMGFGISVGMHAPLTLGMQEILWVVPEPEKVVEAFNKYKPKHFVSGPVIMQAIAEKVDMDLDWLTTFAGGGVSFTLEQEAMVNRILEEHKSSAKCVTGYGMTELAATVCTGMNHVYKPGTLGIPFANVNIKIVDTETLEELEYGQVGEIVVNAPNMMLGYYKNESATDEIVKMHDDGKKWLHTGDLGCIDEDGFIYFKGRLKRIYLTKDAGGCMYKIFPMRIEELFSKHPDVKRCGVVAKPNGERINLLIAYVELCTSDTDVKRIESELLEYAKRELPEHSIPESIFVLDEIKLTQSGKIDYRELEKLANSI